MAGAISPLDQITPANVAKLKPVWIFSTGETRSHESPPIVNNGVMFVTTPMNQVMALDAKSGNLLWRYRRPRPAGASVPRGSRLLLTPRRKSHSPSHRWVN